MRNVMQYYYNLKIDNVKKVSNKYLFINDGISYVFEKCDRSDAEIQELYILTEYLNRIGLPCHNIILNNDSVAITPFNKANYILLKKNIISNDLITINDIINFSTYTSFNFDFKEISRLNWKQLWTNKMDYFEYQLSQIGNKYPLLCNMFSYYEGIVENGIQLFSIYDLPQNICVSHKRIDINTTISDFYNPLNFIIDYKVRDLAEYFKKKTLYESDNEIFYYLDTLTNYDKLLFLIRFFFPSFYFDVYEELLIGNINNNKLDNIINYSNNYEATLKKIYGYVSTYINLPIIDWLKD